MKSSRDINMKTFLYHDLELFKDVRTEVLNKISPKSSHYTKGMTLYSKGSNCQSMDVVLSGTLVAYSLAQNGSESWIFSFETGSIIGANLLFGNLNRYPFNIYATSDCNILSFRREDIELLLTDYQFTMRFIKNLSLNAQGMNQKIAMFTHKTLRDNLMDYLTVLSREQETRTVYLPITKKELADYFGVQRPSLFRELKKMEDEGFIQVDNRKITIHS